VGGGGAKRAPLPLARLAWLSAHLPPCREDGGGATGVEPGDALEEGRSSAHSTSVGAGENGDEAECGQEKRQWCGGRGVAPLLEGLRKDPQNPKLYDTWDTLTE
jgi:hypothetical protein